jgi:beta-glucosidase
MHIVYAQGCDSTFTDTSGFAEAIQAAQNADAVVLVLGETRDMSGEASSRSNINLPGVQGDLLKRIHAVNKRAVLVLMNGRPLAIPWEAANIPAILETWYLGVETGNAIARVLFGDVNPGGKLPITFPQSVGQIPIYYNHKNTGRPFSENEKFTSKYLDAPNAPLYPFGYGLSYTSFSYNNLRVSSPKVKVHGEVKISVDVRNTGSRKGGEVVQLYVHDEVASVTRPVKELKGFQRVSLEPGEVRKVEFILNTDRIGFHGKDMKYVVEPGAFGVFVGGNSVDNLESGFEVVE